MKFVVGAAIAAVSVVTVVGGVVTPPSPGMTLSGQPPVRLVAADAAPPGAIPLAFLRNQFQYCELICPYALQGAVEVPVTVARTPVVFLNALGTTGEVPRAFGAAAASVTGRLSAAVTPIIENDVYRVVPKAFNNLEVSVVELANVASAVLEPARFLPAVHTARVNILAALNQPLPPPAPTETGARGLPQVLAVEAIKVTAAVAFQAGELLLLGVVQSADAAAQELARSGDPVAAVTAGVSQAAETIDVAGGVVRDAVDTAVTNIRGSLDDPVPSSTTKSSANQEESTGRAIASRAESSTQRRQARELPQSAARSSEESESDTSTSESESSTSTPSTGSGSSESATPSAKKNRMNSGAPR